MVDAPPRLTEDQVYQRLPTSAGCDSDGAVAERKRNIRSQNNLPLSSGLLENTQGGPGGV